MKKKLAATLSVVLILGLAVLGILAYLTDTDSDVNVMTLGNVDIEQEEDFEQLAALDPGVTVKKEVTVTNTGESDAYVRTWFAFEMPMGELIIPDWNNSTATEVGKATIDGTEYMLYVVDHDKMANGESKMPLKSVKMHEKAENEDVAKYGGTYEVLVLSQAIQTAGFDSAADAWAASFGAATVENNPWKDAVIRNVKTSDELKNAIKNATVPTTVILNDGNYTTNIKVNGGSDITIIGSKDAVLSGQIATTSSTAGTVKLNGVTVKVDGAIVDSTGISQTGKSAIALWGNQTVICENVTFDMSLADSTAITSWWDTNEGTTIVVRDCVFNCNGQRPIRATGNVTVENCTFNDPYRYAVQLTAKASTATELDKAIVNFNNNTIVNGENGKAFVYGLQLEGADYGCHDLIINGAGNKIVDGGTESTMYYCECGKVVHDTIEWNTEVEAVHEK